MADVIIVVKATDVGKYVTFILRVLIQLIKFVSRSVMPIKVVVLFFLDSFLSLLTLNKFQNEKFSMKKVWWLIKYLYCLISMI